MTKFTFTYLFFSISGKWSSNDSSCTTEIVVQSDALLKENAPPPHITCQQLVSSKSWQWCGYLKNRDDPFKMLHRKFLFQQETCRHSKNEMAWLCAVLSQHDFNILSLSHITKVKWIVLVTSVSCWLRSQFWEGKRSKNTVNRRMKA